ncbi:DNA helicase RecQ [Adhaeribacter soli]|uniref:DNA helicase RecQ n=1 Tax=Adhaeribacter soli TaxID=2607655 RepID=A0A5N1J556_9BACT|nr:DNA helicase RecQ [Adhaeribacter soli]KAA9346051.1 DNA helicase RecQ [Adhaeribacter soli]
MTIQAAKHILKDYFGYDSFRPMQQDIIESVLQNQDVLVLMPTGGGKSLCYQVPALVKPGLCVVVSPLIALMKDQVEALREYGVKAEYLNSTQSSREQEQIENACLAGELKLLYVSPEKLLSAGFFNFLKRLPLNLFAIDEAHCISSWGHDFRPEYTQLKFLKEQFPEVPVIALTATADKLTRQDIQQQLKLEDPKVFISSFDRPNIYLQVKPGRDRIKQILNFLDAHPGQPGIIYCLSRNATESLAAKLQAGGYNAAYYHAGLPAERRATTQEKFLRDDVQIICATIAFGMGIDKSNVRWVIHYNLPKNLEGYYQEIGRAGRDGARSEALLFYSYADVASLRSMLMEGKEGQVDLQMTKLERMQQYAEATFCRRQILLQYFGETKAEPCRNCDICRNPPATFDGTLLAQKALSAITRVKEKATLGTLIDVLRGSRNQSILSKGYDKIKTFGVGHDVPFLEWQNYLHQMLNAGLFEIAYDEGYTLKLNPNSEKVLFEHKKVPLVKFQPITAAAPAERAVRTKPKKELQKDELFDRLKKLRKQLADQHNVPPYVIFSDNTLLEMAAEKPTNRVAMLAISGVGMVKYENYGYEFINEIMRFISDQQDQGNKIKGATHLVTFDLLKQGLSPEQIAKQRELNPVTIFSHIATLYEQGYEINIKQYLNGTEYQAIKAAFMQLGPEAKLKEIYEYLQETYDYFKIRLAAAVFNKENKRQANA